MVAFIGGNEACACDGILSQEAELLADVGSAHLDGQLSLTPQKSQNFMLARAVVVQKKARLR
jgi:hypothetical protein